MQEVTATAVLNYDPLPPPDTSRSYERTHVRSRQIESQGFLSALINSLRPDFDINVRSLPLSLYYLYIRYHLSGTTTTHQISLLPFYLIILIWYHLSNTAVSSTIYPVPPIQYHLFGTTLSSTTLFSTIYPVPPIRYHLSSTTTAYTYMKV